MASVQGSGQITGKAAIGHPGLPCPDRSPRAYSSHWEGSAPSWRQRLTILGVLGLIPLGLGWAASPVRGEDAAPSTAVETSAESLLRPQAAPAPAAPAVVTPTAPAPAVVAPAPSAVIDTTDYGLGATTAPARPNIVFSERGSGCQLTLGDGLVSRVCANGGAPAANLGAGQGLAANPSGSGDGTVAPGNVRIGPVTVGVDGVTVGETTLISREALNARLRPLNVIRRGIEEFVFPLATPAPITSLFGWRTHPIFGDRRFHAGTDIAAPTGTPVVAAKDGTVSTAAYLGGYGLTVILRHDDGNQETRYAHLSQIMVRPGESVGQGEVIGLVGSTGNSTGPHLHFELRQLTAQGWVLVDPNDLLAYAKINLLDTLNQPLTALNALLGGGEGEGVTSEETGIDWQQLPYRPAQPNAS